MDQGAPSELTLRVRSFERAVRTTDTALDEASIAISTALDPSIDPVALLADLDALAASCPTRTREGVMQHLFGSGMFKGDRSDYHSWRNSCIDRVLERRAGMPLTLSIVGIEVARRLGVTLVGVGLPGHFVIGDPRDRVWFADPFHGRTSIGLDGCRRLVEATSTTRWSTQLALPTPNRLVIVRLLSNLRASCERSHDLVRQAIVMRLRADVPELVAERSNLDVALAAFN